MFVCRAIFLEYLSTTILFILDEDSKLVAGESKIVPLLTERHFLPCQQVVHADVVQARKGTIFDYHHSDCRVKIVHTISISQQKR